MKLGGIMSSASGILVVLLLTLGVFAGVLLVKQEQDFRERADELKEHKVAICHKTGSESNEWVQLEVSENAVEVHLAHGDIQGNCPTEDNEPQDETPTDGSSGGTGGSSQPTQLASTVTVNNETKEVATIERIVETEYVYVTTRFDFWIKFQGINEKRDNKTVRVIFRRGEEELHVYNNVVVQADVNGVYSGTITDVRPGTYEVLIKSDGFLQTKFENIVLSRGRNRYYWDDRELLAGDFDSDNDLDGLDVAEFFSFYILDLVPVTDETEIFDVNMNGFIEMDDINLVLSNYSTLRVLGDS